MQNSDFCPQGGLFCQNFENMVSQPCVHVAVRFHGQPEGNGSAKTDFDNSDFGPQGDLFCQNFENMVSQPGVHVAARFHGQPEKNGSAKADFDNSDFCGGVECVFSFSFSILKTHFRHYSTKGARVLVYSGSSDTRVTGENDKLIVCW